ncbi:Z1 domain-containing protein [uncultured Acidaminococcus sp.]|uniref:Z1 domain-containing protein n=1 Tax=uncultured Acidaminococcus sp. TaxID=352152 RepID=UPI0025D900FC|nr:Z1 domain-containing protein [uncultured Acidaminococcus sp.]
MINDLSGFESSDRYFIMGAIERCRQLIQEDNEPIKSAVEISLELFKYNKNIDLDLVRKIIYMEVSQVGSPDPIITTEEVKQEKWWSAFRVKNNNKLGYWIRYYDRLMAKPGWSTISIKDLDNSTDKVMNAIANPTLNQPIERRGLVYGDVQSGKTAHYIGLINKAYSAGYKIIIVLTGMHNSLRSQTQSRIDEEVLKSYRENSNEEFLQSLTSNDIKGDFNRSMLNGSFRPPFIIVTKKQVSVLRNIIKSLIKNPIAKDVDGKKLVPAKYPALIIDDEADQASINTKKDGEDSDPSTINGEIRNLLNLFECKSYVGYTATPFANIFIPPHSKNSEYGQDLFPKDFIAKAPRPSLYIGAQELFGLEDTDNEEGSLPEGMPLVRTISDSDEILPIGAKKDAIVGEIPESLKIAFKSFLLSIAIRNLRGQRNKPNTMLVHVIRYVKQHRTLKSKLKQLKDNVFTYICYGDPEIKKEIQDLYENDFLPTYNQMISNHAYNKYMEGCSKIPFQDAWNEIVRIAQNNEISVLEINGQKKEGLMYNNRIDEPFNLIAIGGDKLSRGLTLEGLTVSYFTRTASAMDTLMQMGRWFGYRRGYIDLCRLFTTRELYNLFQEVSFSTTNLAEQFDDMNTLQCTPETFGLKVATNPNILISARNKVRTGEEYKSDFSYTLAQTRLIDALPETLEENYRTIDDFLSSLDPYLLKKDHAYDPKRDPHSFPKGKNILWTGVPGKCVEDFFRRFRTSKQAVKVSSRLIADYISEMLNYDGLIDWTVCLYLTSGEATSVIATNSKYGPIKVHGIKRKVSLNKNTFHPDTRDFHVLVSQNDEELDYTQEEIVRAKTLRDKLKKNSIGDNRVINREVRRQLRNFSHGFLILYPLEQVENGIEIKDGTPAYGFAVVFPDRGEVGVLRSYKLNEVAMEQEVYE